MPAKNSQKVAVSYPYPTQVSARFHHSLVQLLVRDAAKHQRVVNGGDLIANSSGANITNARNEITAKFLAHPEQPDWLWFIDTDMVFQPDVLDRLVDAAHPTERPVVGALCFSFQNGSYARPTMYLLRDDGRVGVRWEYPRDQLVEVDATGTGCLLIHRSVLEAMTASDKWPAAYPWFMESHLGETPVSEDITFCIRARSIGFPVHVDTAIKVGHEKTLVLDESVYLAQRAMRAVEPPNEPTYVVVASKDRRELLSGLLAGLAHETDVFVLDNGYDPPLPLAVDARDWPLHRMWNHGIELAEKAARDNGHKTWNVAVLNDDLKVERDLLGRLAWGLRSDENIWASYPDHYGAVSAGQVAQLTNPQMAGQTMSGWCFMLRGEAGLRFDEQFQWWYGDSDLERQVREQGKFVVAVGGCQVEHLHPMESSAAKVEAIRDDEARFAAKWGMDPDTLWLAQHPEFGA